MSSALSGKLFAPDEVDSDDELANMFCHGADCAMFPGCEGCMLESYAEMPQEDLYKRLALIYLTHKQYRGDDDV